MLKVLLKLFNSGRKNQLGRCSCHPDAKTWVSRTNRMFNKEPNFQTYECSEGCIYPVFVGVHMEAGRTRTNEDSGVTETLEWCLACGRYVWRSEASKCSEGGCEKVEWATECDSDRRSPPPHD